MFRVADFPLCLWERKGGGIWLNLFPERFYSSGFASKAWIGNMMFFKSGI